VGSVCMEVNKKERQGGLEVNVKESLGWTSYA
jgi:hypothetical protein